MSPHSISSYSVLSLLKVIFNMLLNVHIFLCRGPCKTSVRFIPMTFCSLCYHYKWCLFVRLFFLNVCYLSVDMQQTSVWLTILLNPHSPSYLSVQSWMFYVYNQIIFKEIQFYFLFLTSYTSFLLHGLEYYTEQNIRQCQKQ